MTHLTEYLDASAARWPDRPAVIEPDGRQLTYADLARQSDALAAFLASRGVMRGDRVGMCVPKSLEAVVAIFGIMKAGAAYVPVDPTGPIERGRKILEDCAVRAVVVSDRLVDVVPKAGADGEPPVVVHPPFGNSQFTIHNSQLRDAGDLAYIIYTSGSTGTPKGVMITHANALAFTDWCGDFLEVTEHDRFSGYSPFHFDASAHDLWPAVRHGAAVCLIPDALGRSPRALAAFIAEARLTIWTSTPSALITLVEFGDLTRHDCARLRVVNFGGEVFPVKHLRALRRAWPSAAFHNLYGPTETTTTCTWARIPADIPDDRSAPYPIGQPCPHCRAMVVDDEGREVAAGEEGVLHISGPSVFAGYWNRPDDTAAATVTRDGARWYNTGDVVVWNPAEGLTFVGRRDGLVKRRGYRIEIGEVERVLNAHPRLVEAAVVADRPTPDVVHLVAFVAGKDGRAPSIVDIKTFCAAGLPAWMAPDRIVIVGQLPRTSSGKVDHQALKAGLARAGAA
jgi:amino acid adenylation domain-containing protein